MSRTFRVQRKYWLKSLGWPAVALLLTFGLAFLGFRSGDAFGGAVIAAATGAFLLALWAFGYLRRAWTRLEIDERGFHYCYRHHTTSFVWSHIVTTSFYSPKPVHPKPFLAKREEPEHPRLFLATSAESLLIDLAGFDAQEIWSTVQSHVPAAALQPESYKRLPQYQEWDSYHAQLAMDPSTPLRAPASPVLRFVIGGIAVAFVVFALSIRHVPVATLIFFGLAAMTALGAIMVSSVEIDGAGITRLTPLTRYHMRWEDVEQMELDADGHEVRFFGKGKQIVVTGPARWKKADRERIAAFLDWQSERRGIKQSRHKGSAIWFSKNTRVPLR